MTKTMLFALSALGAGMAIAQEGRNHPAKPDAAVPPVTYRSAFEDYRPYKEQDVASWREVNDEVARVGGHAGVLKAEKERQATKPPAGGRSGGGPR